MDVNSFEQLPNWSGLTKEEQERLLFIHAPRLEAGHNIMGEESIFDVELQKYEAPKEGVFKVNTPLVIPANFVSKYNDYRDEIWGDSYNWSFIRTMAQIQKLAIHHTVTRHEATPQDIALLHKARGWAGIGYHFVITKDGTVYYVGDILTGRANIGGNNEKIIGIVLVGDFTRHLPSDDQIRAAHGLCRFFLTNYPPLANVSEWDSDLMGHKDAALVYKWPGADATACPGSSWPDDMKWRIKTNTVYSPQPQPEPQPEPQPNPQPTPDELYRVTHKGQQLVAVSENPVPKIEGYNKIRDRFSQKGTMATKYNFVKSVLGIK